MSPNGELIIFKDRSDAGQRLARVLAAYSEKETVVFAIPRGGVPVAVEVASAIQAKLDIIIVRKIPVPYQTEAGLGAVTEDGTIILNQELIQRLDLDKNKAEIQAAAVRNEIMRRSMLYRRKISPKPVKGKTAIIIDDGLASGFTMLAAIESLRHRKAAEVVVAVPVASGTAYDTVSPVVDKLVSLLIIRSNLFAVADYYQNWHDLDDDEMSQYLEVWRSQSRV